jgi:hypothetical protein
MRFTAIDLSHFRSGKPVLVIPENAPDHNRAFHTPTMNPLISSGRYCTANSLLSQAVKRQ